MTALCGTADERQREREQRLLLQHMSAQRRAQRQTKVREALRWQRKGQPKRQPQP